MSQHSIEQLYEQQIKILPRSDRLRLLARIADDLASLDEGDTSSVVDHTEPAEHSGLHAVAAADDDTLLLDILDLEGVGADVWRGVDVRTYIDELRDEWDKP